jgi:cysteinyl-tRNA synthetase
MKVYNTLSRQLEEFKPIEENKVRFYHCGPTVYWVQHIGNLRGTTMADLIRRTFIYLGYQVKFVRNYTDVGHLTSDQDEGEDKMEKGVQREGLQPQEIANKYIKIYESDSKAINILPPDFSPRASNYIKEMIAMIQTLLDKGFAYITDLAVVYDTSKFPNYNQLNRQKIDENKSGWGKGQVVDPGKKHFSDFNLWVFKKGIHKNALQTWPSPWGEGFPGWHIECSVMAKSLLGETIDIHMGGVEHIPVHHTNEIAQSEAANGVKFVNYWLHNEHLVVNDKKMAKSEGTGLTLKEVIEKGYDPLSLRYFFLNAHYRSKQNFTWEALNAAQEGYKKLKEYILTLQKQTQRTQLSPEKLTKVKEYQYQFLEAISNDFQIPQALAVAWEMLKSNIPSNDKIDLIYDFDQVFGLNLREIKEETIPQEIIDLAEKRQQAKQSQDYQTADTLRNQINKLGYKIEDTNQGYKIKKI